MQLLMVISALEIPLRAKNLEAGGYTVSWNSEIDLSEHELWQHGEEMPLQSAFDLFICAVVPRRGLRSLPS